MYYAYGWGGKQNKIKAGRRGVLPLSTRYTIAQRLANDPVLLTLTILARVGQTKTNKQNSRFRKKMSEELIETFFWGLTALEGGKRIKSQKIADSGENGRINWEILLEADSTTGGEAEKNGTQARYTMGGGGRGEWGG